MVTYLEKVQSLSPASAGFGMQGGRAVYPVFVDYDELDDAITDLLGDVGYGTDARLNRSLPTAHPRWPWLFAERISNIVGMGSPTLTASVEALEAPSALLYYAEYPQYELSVEFLPRPYAVLPDESITLSSIQWYDQSGGAQFTEVADEWIRFTDYDIQPSAELLTAQQGFMVFRRGDGVSEGSPEPHLRTFTGFPRMFLGKALIKFRWFQVPFYYVESQDSWIVKGMGQINQLDWYGWPAGSLLYHGCQVTRYTPPVPVLDPVLGDGVYSTEKLCDIEFVFEYVNRTSPSVPSPANASNSNFIAAGHNLIPWLQNRKFYYATAVDGTVANQAPTYYSFPFQLLFQNPDMI